MNKRMKERKKMRGKEREQGEECSTLELSEADLSAS
jgi:hypothetical protein